MNAYLWVLWLFCGLCLASPLIEDLEVKEEQLRIVNGRESIPGKLLPRGSARYLTISF